MSPVLAAFPAEAGALVTVKRTDGIFKDWLLFKMWVKSRWQKVIVHLLLPWFPLLK